MNAGPAAQALQRLRSPARQASREGNHTSVERWQSARRSLFPHDKSSASQSPSEASPSHVRFDQKDTRRRAQRDTDSSDGPTGGAGQRDSSADSWLGGD